MDIISSAKNVGSSAFGSSSSGSSGSDGGGGGGGIFSSFTSLSIQKMALLLGIIAFIISVGTVAILLWKSKSTQKWPPEISKCPDRMDVSGTGDNAVCVDNYGLFGSAPGYSAASTTTPCSNFDAIKSATYTSTGFNGDGAYVPWEGVVDGKSSRASSLKCTTT
jgi:hypothetical protein